MTAPHPGTRPHEWVRPGPDGSPLWGHRDGMRVGLPPLLGPRGLLRVYTPYLGHDPDRMVNYVAIEPRPRRSVRRGYSELERSRLDDEPGLRLWTGEPGPGHDPGVVEVVAGVECLTVLVHCERFAGGAEVDVRVRFRADRPHEVELAAVTRPGSVPLRHCVLSATMGNFARLRTLRLLDGPVRAGELWPRHRSSRFTRRARFGLHRLPRDVEGAAVVTVLGDEPAPEQAAYAADVAPHWHWYGRRAEQSWVVPDPSRHLVAAVNGRVVYWASRSPIPGGIAFENVEVIEPYRPLRPLRFRVEPCDPAPHGDRLS
ncbi:hypothetical protein [Auraticoccus monumenti]|uniref:Methane oxygenase PmoA n=1 Tax=Auraticoccus monumenti TaxID=675864 RepID=A0A1G7AB97_9ACTN|nr:hypothetical protein [Auraticoccus monumenti]SDE11146.1 hypothetical protein SAMN04489747_2543 [Auraticoccus monumenti]